MIRSTILYHFLIILFICINHNFHKIIRIIYRDDRFDQIKIDFHHGIRKKPLHE